MSYAVLAEYAELQRQSVSRTPEETEAFWSDDTSDHERHLQRMVRYTNHSEILAMFDREADAVRSTAPLRYEVHVVVNSEIVPLGVSFKYLSECSMYAAQHMAVIRDNHFPDRGLQ
jgi:hypothetical protein